MFEGYGGPVQMKATDLSGIDPTLDACCQREIEGNRKQNALEATLKRHDRIALAERRRRNIIDSLSFGSGCRCCYDPNLDGGEYFALAELRSKLGEQNQEETDELNQHDDKDRKLNASDSDDSDSDDEFDYLLDEDLPVHNEDGGYSEFQSYEQQRMEEIQLMAMINESAVQHGFGVHRQFGPERVLHAAGLGMGGIRGNRAAAIPPAAVVHLYDPDSEYGASLDLCLEELGKTYKGTKFLFGTLKGTLALNETLVKQEMPSLNILDECPPALLAVKDGVVKAVCTNLKSLGDERLGKVEPRAVEHWLDNAGVLLRDIPLEYEDYCRIRPEEDALLENMMREKAKLEQMKEMIYTCGVNGCNKTFRHEHIGVNNEVQSGRVLCEEIVTGEGDGVEK